MTASLRENQTIAMEGKHHHLFPLAMVIYINRGGRSRGEVRAPTTKKATDAPCSFQIDGITDRTRRRGTALPPGQASHSSMCHTLPPGRGHRGGLGFDRNDDTATGSTNRWDAARKRGRRTATTCTNTPSE